MRLPTQVCVCGDSFWIRLATAFVRHLGRISLSSRKAKPSRSENKEVLCHSVKMCQGTFPQIVIPFNKLFAAMRRCSPVIQLSVLSCHVFSPTYANTIHFSCGKGLVKATLENPVTARHGSRDQRIRICTRFAASQCKDSAVPAGLYRTASTDPCRARRCTPERRKQLKQLQGLRWIEDPTGPTATFFLSSGRCT